MGSRSVQYTFTGGEATPGTFVTTPLPTFTGNFTITYAVAGGAGAILNMFMQLWTPGTGVACYYREMSMFSGDTSKTDSVTVGNPPGSGIGQWSCSTWTEMRWGYTSSTQRAAAGKVLTVTIAGANVPDLPPSPCVSRIKASMPAVAVIDNVILSSALALIPSSWWGFILQWYIGFTLDVNVLCAGLPPSVPTILTDWLRNPGHGALNVLYATLWPYYCECTPATPPAVDPPKPTPPKPPDYPNNPVYPTPCTDPCLDMTDIRSRLDALARLVQRDLELDGLMQRYDLPFAIIPGAVHSGLTGSGSFAISRLAGLRIELTSSPPGKALEGTPPYLWDLGWASVNDGGAMLQEVRVTRTSFEWFPQHVQMATQFGYFAKPGATLRVTELAPEP